MNARIVYRTVVKYQNVAEVLAKFASIDLTPDIEGWEACYGPSFRVCEDTALEDPPGSGILKRIVKLRYGTLFLSTFPTVASKSQNLKYFGLGLLRMQLPGEVEIYYPETDWEASDCPAPP